ncbi:MAG: ABC transporter permease [Bacteroidota bacterium]
MASFLYLIARSLTINPTDHIMLKNYFTIAWRNVQRNKGYTLMNIAGLAFGLAVFIAVLVYVNYETSFDKWDKQLKRVYRVDNTQTWGSDASTTIWTPYPFGTQLLSISPEIQGLTRVFDKGEGLITAGDKQIYVDKIMAADSAFLNVLPYHLKYGNALSALKQPGQAIISSALSYKLFGVENSIGKTFTVDTYKLCTVIGIYEATGPSHLDFNICMSLFTKQPDHWGFQQYITYVLLKPGATTAALPAKSKTVLINGIAAYSYTSMSKSDLKLSDPGNQQEQWLKTNMQHTIDQVVFKPVADIHLFSTATAYRDAIENHPLFNFKSGNGTPVIFFSIAAVLVLVLACINYINLSIARAGKRAKEAGMRKVMGAGRYQLIKQFLAEAFVQSFIALILGLVLAKWIVSLINSAFNMHLTFFNRLLPSQGWVFSAELLLLILMVTLLSGAYPAFVLSSFRPARVLKGEITKSVKGKLLRNSLVILQFSISACFIIGMIVVYKQLHYINSTDPGFSTEQVLVLKPKSSSIITPQDNNQKIDLIRTQLSQLPGVKGVAVTDFYPGTPSMVSEADASYNNREGKITFDYVHFDYFKVLSMKIISGRDFSQAYTSDTVNSAVINETAARYMGFKESIGQTVKVVGRGYHIIGIVKDNHVAGYNSKIVPELYAIGVNKQLFGGYKSVLVKISGRDAAATTKAISAYWKAIEPAYPLRYSWLDQDFARLLDKYERFGKITILLSGVSIIIALMGIFALSAFAAAQRTKEIGIRKVFGASVAGITAMLSLDFLKLVSVALLIAFPVSYWGTHQWLQEFAYRIPLTWLIFFFAGIIILSIALITVSIQAIKAAVVNPVKSLRAE